MFNVLSSIFPLQMGLLNVINLFSIFYQIKHKLIFQHEKKFNCTFNFFFARIAFRLMAQIDGNNYSLNDVISSAIILVLCRRTPSLSIYSP